MQNITNSSVESSIWDYGSIYFMIQKNGEFNPHDVCVAGKHVNGKQHTVQSHAKYLMSIHMDKKVNTRFDKWLNKINGGYGKVKSRCGKVHDYTGIAFDFSKKKKR